VAADAYGLPFASNSCDCGFAAFWLSHVPRPDVGRFLENFAAHLRPGSPVLLIDTKWVAGYTRPVTRRDSDGNTYQIRTLQDGSRYEILKNYFTESELFAYLAPLCHVEVRELRYVWAVSATLC
jgi:demethylmenaquinone methyltransferase/2-methoxy-6-polyprenyl-1,4-benzoquinol methylase